MLKEILDKTNKIAILWFWKEGQSSLKFLLKQGKEKITVLDGDAGKENIFRELQKNNKNLDWIFWWKYLDTLWDFDVIIKTPGISPFWEKLRPYKERFISQTHIFFNKYIGKVIWITGTKGKSTVSTLLYMSIKDLWYKVKLVGNIGNPVLDEVDIISWEKYDYIIYELSSYMLQDFIPKLDVWILNNIYPCHLDWHYDSFNIYKEAKLNILKDAHIKIVNAEFSCDREIQELTWERHFFWDKWKVYVESDGVYTDWNKIIWEQDMILKWKHNFYNIAAVLQCLLLICNDLSWVKENFKTTLKSFRGLPHRLQSIWIYEWIEFIDDAIATTPESTIAAINAIDGKLQTLFLWWQDSGFIFNELRKKILTSSIEMIVAFPDTSELVFPEIRYRPYDVPFEMMIEWKNILYLKTRSMKIAVWFTFRNSFPGRTVLLSSAAPSFSLWKNYIAKAEDFIKEIQNF